MEHRLASSRSLLRSTERETVSRSRGQASFEVLLMIGFVFVLSAVMIVNYLQIAPSIEGMGVVKSSLIASLAGVEPANSITYLQYGVYPLSNNQSQPLFTVLTSRALPSCSSITIDDAFDQLAGIGVLDEPMIRVNDCKTIILSAHAVYDSGTVVESESQQQLRVQEECQAIGKTPLLLIQSFAGNTAIDRARTDVDFGSTREQTAMALTPSTTTQVKIAFANDCCLGWNGSACTRGGTDVEVTGVQLDDKKRELSITFFEETDEPLCLNTGSLTICN